MIDTQDLRAEQHARTELRPAPCTHCGYPNSAHWSPARICPVAPHLTVFKARGS
jgi:hypothetical protein